MAQTLIAFYCFNDNNISSVKDFSVNERHSVSVTDLTIASSYPAVGKTGVFNGTSTNIGLGNITAFNSLSAMTICTKIKLSAIDIRQVISLMGFNHTLEITSANKVKLTIDTGAPVSLTDTHILSKDVWYKIIAMYDGANIFIYIDSTDSPSSAALTGSTAAVNEELLFIGYDSTDDWLNANMEMLSYYSKSLTADELEALLENPSGRKYEVLNDKIQTGDLIHNDAGGSEVVVWYEEFDERLFSDNEQHLFNEREAIIFPN